jgi:hypothetical protein
MPDPVIGPRIRAVENMVARARAANRQQSGQDPCTTCPEVEIWASFFFDGTGNNKEQHFPNSHSNVAGLFDAHKADRAAGVARFYYEGIGTKFEFEQRHRTELRGNRAGVYKVDVNGYEEGDSKWNSAFGSNMDVRLEKAVFDLESIDEDIRARRKVKSINIAAFGFSRGATTARAFMHWLKEHSKIKVMGRELEWDGIPFKVKFLGLFDTVESVGEAGGNDQPKLIKTSVPTFVEKACHIIAAHEMRQAFPVTVLGSNQYTQVVYPGAHADIGGGYGPTEQARTNNLARVAGVQMLDEARGANLKMFSVGEMQGSERWGRLFKPSFEVMPATKKAWSDYQPHLSVQAGPIDRVIHAHLTLYRAWLDAGLAMEDAMAKRKAVSVGSDEADALGRQRHLYQFLLKSQRGRTGEKPLRGGVPAGVENLFENYVHDSFEHFSLTGGTLMADFSEADYYRDRTVLAPKS